MIPTYDQMSKAMDLVYDNPSVTGVKIFEAPDGENLKVQIYTRPEGMTDLTTYLVAPNGDVVDIEEDDAS